MENFRFLCDVQVVFPLLFRTVGEKKIRLSLSPARMSLGLAELGKKKWAFSQTYLGTSALLELIEVQLER